MKLLQASVITFDFDKLPVSAKSAMVRRDIKKSIIKARGQRKFKVNPHKIRVPKDTRDK